MNLNAARRFRKDRKSPSYLSYNSQKPPEKAHVQHSRPIKNLKIERFKRLSSRSCSPSEELQLKSRQDTSLLNRSMLNTTVSISHTANSQLEKFESTENEWKKIKEGMRDSMNLKNSLVRSSINKYSLSYVTSVSPAFGAAKNSKFTRDSNNLLHKRRGEKVKKSRVKNVTMMFSESSEDQSNVAEELSPCSEASIAKPKETLKPISFFSKPNTRLNSLPRLKAKENNNPLNRNSSFSISSALPYRP